MADVSTALSALADPTRRTVFERIAERPRSVGELAGLVPVSRPAVSQHLAVLKSAGLVADRAVGTRRIYHIDPHGLGQIRVWLDRFWTDALQAFETEIDRTEGRHS